ncbi:DNA-binding MarR family transcriptional regulator [Streptomyces griseochromogenes]|uniref:MarR family transcriptional regulator n=1 Tax=Streptomyces griseochromogenes TaxID=68214 RepID=A0A1B1B7F8_9ACTN|nr:MarR family winged helix-turn-helix transcriptional regulator [Streptomyces griseochromogenes]ANP54774.1 MarR family transcriptional regulator [Streptomyces griseochromogenes]MBP2048656.1 DNA-binding MarR family transcriptional regulator [Streptomyces griseochromogenes]
MNEVKGSAGLPGTLTFRLGTLGSAVGDRFAERIERHGLKPKHVGLLTALGQGAFASQQDLAGRLGVAPSLVVSLADHLESLDAVRRVRDPRDRRRQVLTLTDRGHELLATCTTEARALDAELTAHLGEPERQALFTTLGGLAARAGLPTD